MHAKYIIKRLLMAVLVLLIVTVIILIAVRLAPGDPVLNQLGPYGARTPEREAQITAQLGLDKPVVVQYFVWLKNIVTGNFGVSLRNGRPVMDIIMEKVPASLELILVSIFFALLIAVPFGILAAVKRNSWIDQVISFVSTSMLAIPSFCIGLLLILFFAVQLKVLPASGFVAFSENPLSNIQHLLMPALALGLFETANFIRFIRSDTIEVLGANYIRTAKAKGVPKKKIYFKHAFKNILVTLITVVGLEFGTLLGGTVIVEQMFGWSGIGWLVFQSVQTRDYAVVQTTVLLVACVFVVLNMVIDIIYAAVDPRIKLD
ncbi:MAG: ABC transporter permease [Angelakisella sp.]